MLFHRPKRAGRILLRSLYCRPKLQAVSDHISIDKHLDQIIRTCLSTETLNKDFCAYRYRDLTTRNNGTLGGVLIIAFFLRVTF